MTAYSNGTPLSVDAAHWILCRTYQTRQGTRIQTVKVYRGPYSELAAAFTAINAMSYVEGISPSVPDGSAVCTLTVTFASPAAWWTPLSPHEVREPVWSIQPVMDALPLANIPMFDTYGAVIEEIERAMRDGSAAGMNAGSVGGELYRKWRLQGVNAIRCTSYELRRTRFFDEPSHFPDLTTEYALANSVRTWAQIGAPPHITEPKIIQPGAAAAVPIEWLYSGPCPQYDGKYATVVDEWAGAIRYPKDFYSGGTWTV